jgi:hypothetical protein
MMYKRKYLFYGRLIFVFGFLSKDTRQVCVRSRCRQALFPDAMSAFDRGT